MQRLFLLLLLLIPVAWAADFGFNRNLVIEQENSVLTVDQAFHLQKMQVEGKVITLKWDITDGYYLYRDKTILKAEGMTLGEPQWPTGAEINDEMFGKQIVYYQTLTLPIPFTAQPNAKIATLTVTYQGCQVNGICYPPTTQTLSFDPNQVVPAATNPPLTPPATSTPAPTPTPAAGTTTPPPQAGLDNFFLTIPT